MFIVFLACIPSVQAFLTSKPHLYLSFDCSTTSASDAIGLADQTNVVVKGVIGLAAMSEIADSLGHLSDASNLSVSLIDHDGEAIIAANHQYLHQSDCHLQYQ